MLFKFNFTFKLPKNSLNPSFLCSSLVVYLFSRYILFFPKLTNLNKRLAVKLSETSIQLSHSVDADDQEELAVYALTFDRDPVNLNAVSALTSEIF